MRRGLGWLRGNLSVQQRHSTVPFKQYCPVLFKQQVLCCSQRRQEFPFQVLPSAPEACSFRVRFLFLRATQPAPGYPAHSLSLLSTPSYAQFPSRASFRLCSSLRPCSGYDQSLGAQPQFQVRIRRITLSKYIFCRDAPVGLCSRPRLCFEDISSYGLGTALPEECTPVERPLQIVSRPRLQPRREPSVFPLTVVSSRAYGSCANRGLQP